MVEPGPPQRSVDGDIVPTAFDDQTQGGFGVGLILGRGEHHHLDPESL
jgi:hypothetical protein